MVISPQMDVVDSGSLGRKAALRSSAIDSLFISSAPIPTSTNYPK
jgi:hypothetical protein